MHTTFLIGNGFDIKMGLKTKYKDFYNFYINKNDNSSPVITNLKIELQKYLNGDDSKWADLELELGKHTKKINTYTEFNTVISDLIEKLSEHIRKEENNFTIGNEVEPKHLIYDDLTHSEDFLKPIDKEKIKDHKMKWQNTSPWVTDIISFNYTTTFEKLIEYNEQESTTIGKAFGNNINISNISHIHGLIDRTILLGVNDVSQINNESFHQNIDILELLVKPQTNAMLKQGIETECKAMLNNSNLICLFGLSIGETDKIWWEHIGNQLNKDCKIIYFVKEEEDVDERYLGQIE
ncbi:AbiH family protein [uncultured Bacteroides sp.]|uniref:AbiH family protein n=1 Tax=uncultured Bacteroides sp. TaxID=162156 RepID=UPI002AAB09F3|nr:AbiH family protein [uncultured Bacteroides sp.]